MCALIVETMATVEVHKGKILNGGFFALYSKYSLIFNDSYSKKKKKEEDGKRPSD